MSRIPLIFVLSVLCCSSVFSSVEITDTEEKQSCSRFARSTCLKKYADGLDAIKEGMGDTIRMHPGKVVAASNKPIVFGVGSGTTGTRSLGVAIHRLVSHFGLELKVSHWLHSPLENCEWLGTLLDIVGKHSRERCQKELRSFDYTGIASTVGAILDYPTYELFIDFYLAYPNARWILSTRPSNDWAKDRIKKHAGTPWPVQEPCGMQIKKNTSVDEVSRAFSLTNDFIRCVVPEERLLEIDLFTEPTTEIMMRLRKFLGFTSTALDNEEFPHSKDSPEAFCPIDKDKDKPIEMISQG